MAVPWNYFNHTGQTTVQVCSGVSELIAVVVNTAAASAVVTIFDGSGNQTTTALTKVATIDASATGNFFYGCLLRAGLTATMSGGTANVTYIFADYTYTDDVLTTALAQAQPDADYVIPLGQ